MAILVLGPYGQGLARGASRELLPQTTIGAYVLPFSIAAERLHKKSQPSAWSGPTCSTKFFSVPVDLIPAEIWNFFPDGLLPTHRVGKDLQNLQQRVRRDKSFPVGPRFEPQKR